MDITTTKDAHGNDVVQLAGLVHAPMRAVWEILADTQRLNQEVFGLPPVAVVGLSSQVIQGEASYGAFEVAFDEQPWIYEAPRRYKSVRIFSKGPLQRLESSVELDDVAAGASGTSTDVVYRVVLTTKGGPVGWATSKIVIGQTEAGLDKVRHWLLALAEGRAPPAFVHSDRAAVRKRADAFAAALLADGHDRVLVEGLLEHVAAGPDDEVARIRPYALAEKWSQQKHDVLSLCLDAVRVGLLQMRWETLCPSCRGTVHDVAHLDEVPDAHSCPVCDLEIDASRTSNVAAVFAPVFEVRKAQRAFYCLGSPSRTPHWLAQLVLEPGASQDLPTTLGAGRYLLQSPGIKVRTVLDVGETGDERVRITLEHARGGQPPTLPAATPTLREGKVALALKNEDEQRRRVQLVHEGFADLSATAAHVVETEAWKRLSAS